MHSKLNKSSNLNYSDSKPIDQTMVSNRNRNKSDFSKEEMLACDVRQEEYLLNLIDCEIS